MRICLDVRYKTESGASSYIRNVVSRVLSVDRNNEYLLLKYAEQSFDFERSASDVLVCPSSSDVGHILWSSVSLPALLRKRDVDVYHAMKMPATCSGARSNVITMHSIIDPFKGEFPVSWKARLFLSSFARAAIGRADRLIAVSDFVQEYVIEKHAADPDIVDVVYNGVDERFRVLSPEEMAAITQWSFAKPYVLCVGNVVRVKNHVTALKAFALIAAEVPHGLVIAGAMDNGYSSEVVREAERLGVRERVTFLGFVERDGIVELMNGADVLLFPSLTEGCPVTMLEAFGCGLPIVATKRGGLWDVGRDVALFVDDPLDAVAFADRLRTLLRSASEREERRRSALAHAKNFSWDIAASEHIRIYGAAAARVARGASAGHHQGIETSRVADQNRVK